MKGNCVIFTRCCGVFAQKLLPFRSTGDSNECGSDEMVVRCFGAGKWAKMHFANGIIELVGKLNMYIRQSQCQIGGATVAQMHHEIYLKCIHQLGLVSGATFRRFSTSKLSPAHWLVESNRFDFFSCFRLLGFLLQFFFQTNFVHAVKVFSSAVHVCDCVCESFISQTKIPKFMCT